MPVPEHMARLLMEQEVCVLATCAGGAPRASLMSYAVCPGLSRIVMATLASTRKWENICRNPHVSLLVDERERFGELGREGVRALTVTGIHEPAADTGERLEALALLAARHPHLEGFLASPGVEVIRITPLELLLLTGTEHAERIVLKKYERLLDESGSNL